VRMLQGFIFQSSGGHFSEDLILYDTITGLLNFFFAQVGNLDFQISRLRATRNPFLENPFEWRRGFAFSLESRMPTKAKENIGLATFIILFLASAPNRSLSNPTLATAWQTLSPELRRMARARKTASPSSCSCYRLATRRGRGAP